MTEEQTYSWIFTAIAIASPTKPLNYSEISNVADGINHAIPTQKELQTSINWLIKNELIRKIGKKYELSEKGADLFKESSDKESLISNIWKNLELSFKTMPNNA